jgi:hypothetical protein
MLDYLMEKISFSRWMPRPIRNFIYYYLIIVTGRINIKKFFDVQLGALFTEGILRLKDIGSEAEVQTLKSRIVACPFKNKYGINGELARRSYDHQSLVGIDSVLDFALEPSTIDLCEAYFKARVSVAYIAAWETFSTSVDDLGEMSFHMDHHGHKFLKKFCYLDDTFEGDGQHQYIRGTTDKLFNHKRWNDLSCRDPQLYRDLKLKRRLKGAFTLSNDRVASFFNDDVKNVVGSAGTVFIEDTYGLHRGTQLPPGKSRMILQVLYVPWVLKKDRSNNIIVNLNCSRYADLNSKVMRESYSFNP